MGIMHDSLLTLLPLSLLTYNTDQFLLHLVVSVVCSLGIVCSAITVINSYEFGVRDAFDYLF